jgi:1-acyl-sn-glycerol-3-phosphate acyltransferase
VTRVRPVAPRRAAAAGRRALWKAVLALSGGLRATGGLPPPPCVIVANHSSHADTAALLAALPPGRSPVVAAAADHWFRHRARALWCRSLCAAFPVRRGGGGSDDLAAAVAFLAAGHDVIVFPEGTRSRDGRVARFHSGAARLAQAACVPLVPARIEGTGRLFPVVGGVRRTQVTVRFGPPVDRPALESPAHQSERARAAVIGLSAETPVDTGMRATTRATAQRRRALRTGAVSVRERRGRRRTPRRHARRH